MWGVLAGVAAVVAVWVAVVLIGKRSQRQREERRRRYALPLTDERVPMAPVREPPPPGVLPRTPEVAAFLSSSGERTGGGGLELAEVEATADAGVELPIVGGRIVETPEGEMMLTTPPFALRESILGQREMLYAAAIRGKLVKAGLAGVSGLVLCPKVRLESLLMPTPPDARDPRDWRVWRKRVRLRSVDFVLCDARRWRPVLAIEIDRPDRQATKLGGGVDRIIDEVLGEVGLPLVRCTGDPETDWGMIEPYIRGEVSASTGAR